MHLVIAFAAPGSDAGRAAMQGLRLPRLQALIGGLDGERDEGDEWSLSPPHERALARAWGWAGGDGRLPFAAHHAAADDIDPGTLAWGELTPAHWHLGTDQVSLTDPAELLLDDAGSRAYFDAVAPLFTSEGFVASYGAPLRWYVAHESLAALATASIDRVVGRNVDRWLGSGKELRLVRRLQNEVQMRLHEHPLNTEREGRGGLPVNSFWLSGCGVRQPSRGDALLETRLRSCALAEDWPGWAKAWAVIEEELPARRLTRLTLCGERSTTSFALVRRGWFARASAAWKPAGLGPLWASL